MVESEQVAEVEYEKSNVVARLERLFETDVTRRYSILHQCGVDDNIIGRVNIQAGSLTAAKELMYRVERETFDVKQQIYSNIMALPIWEGIPEPINKVD